MNPAASFYKSVSAIVAALQTAVQAVQLPEEPYGAGNAFGRVEIFDSEDLAAAFQFLTIVDQRVCVIVPLEEKFTRESKNTKLIVHRVLPVALLISDRVLGNRKQALLGDNQTTPGAMGLLALTLPAVTGMLLPNPSGVVSEPIADYVMVLKNNADKKLPNRICVCLEMNCRGGRLEAAVMPVT
jgi:hypothetical protein